MTKDAFISMAIKNLLNDNFSIQISQTKKLDGFGGWFDAVLKEFAVAYKSSVGFDTFVHEYCHYLQWSTDYDFYKKYQWSFDGFMKTFSTKYRNNSIILELDCEKRAVETIKKYKLPIDITYYIKCANAYMFSYHVVQKHKKWPSKGIYYAEMLKYCPTELYDIEFYLDPNNIPPGFIKSMDKWSYKKTKSKN